MSVSPQSLARTRDKRSHKVPARFNDTVYALKDATEVIRTSTRSRPGSLVSKRDHDDDGEEKEEALKIIKTQNVPYKKTQSKPGVQNDSITTPARPLVEHVDPNSPTTPPPSTTPSPTIPINTVQTQAEAAAAPPATTSTPPTTSITNNNNNNATNLHKQTISSNNSSKKESSSSSVSSVSKKKSNKGLSLIAKKQHSTKQDETNKPATPRQGSAAIISGGVSNFNIHQSNQTVQLTTNATPVVFTNGTSQPAAPANPQVASSLPVSTPTLVHAQQGPRYFNNLTTNQQYGTRLLLNEPIYLPRSVPTIAPITATLHQIALQARRPPFISKKAEAYLAYQEERKLNYITSNHAALIKIATYLNVTDRLNLRRVSRTWKSVIDCESVWKKVIVDSNDVKIKWKHLIARYLEKYGTTEIVFHEFPLGRYKIHRIFSLATSLRLHVLGLKRLSLKSVDTEQNTVALALLEHYLHGPFGQLSPAFVKTIRDRQSGLPCITCHIEWKIKVGVDPTGLAIVPFNRRQVGETLKPMGPNDFIELYDLKALYENNPVFKINIQPI